MSVFVEQQHSVCDFSGGEAWTILSPIEQSIRRKIESVGTPLKDWDISIYRGVLTGYNDAFIVDTNKRDEILANCQTEEEYNRTAELIRPILRGRDIKRYGYDWAEKYLIGTFPSRHYDIEQYPAVKNYLLAFGIERLEQTGKTHIVNGKKVKARKKTNNKWFETQDSISYWEDFDKPKLIWKIIGSKLAFTVDTEGYVVNNACYLMTGDYLNHILAFLNSSPLIWYSEITNMNKTGVGDAQVGAQNIVIFPIPKPGPQYDIVSDTVEELLKTSTKGKIEELQRAIYNIFELTKDEIDYLNQQNL